MTAPKGGEIIEAVARPDLLAPGTVQRPDWIDETTWLRMPWPAQWRAARSAYSGPVSAPSSQVSTGVHDEPTSPARPYRGGPVASQPCGTYAAYRRHIRRRERPCAACTEANRRDTNQRYRLKHGSSRRTGLDLELVDSFVRDEALWQDLSVDERIEAARRMDANGISRRVIARRTRLNTANLRRAFYPQDNTTAIDSSSPHDDAERAS